MLLPLETKKSQKDAKALAKRLVALAGERLANLLRGCNQEQEQEADLDLLAFKGNSRFREFCD